MPDPVSSHLRQIKPVTAVPLQAALCLPVFVINLPESTDRRARITAQLAMLGITPIILPAKRGVAADLDGSGYGRLRRRLFYGRDLMAGEYGCARSQLAVYQYMIDNNISEALVLEDDALVDAAQLADILAALKACVEKIGPFYDFIRFLDEEKARWHARRIVRLLPEVHLYRPFKQTGGAYGYLVTQKAARRLLKMGATLWRPVDTMHAQAWMSGLQVFSISPSPIKPDHDIDSTIGDFRFDKKSQLTSWQRAVYPLTRLVYKLTDGGMSRLRFWWQRRGDEKMRRKLGGKF